MTWIDRKYIDLLSFSIRNFKRKSSSLYNLSCPLCGDSAKDRRKARGYIFSKGSNFNYMCHNCGASMSFSRFLNTIDPLLYNEYQFERYRERNPEREIQEKKKSSSDDFSLQGDDLSVLCSKISTLDSGHSAYQYLKKRRIPIKRFDDLYYTDNLANLTDIFPKYVDTKFMIEGRIIIPIRNRRNELVGITARAVHKSELRYIIMRKDDDEPLIYNLENISMNKRVYVTEGAFDSMFLPNSVAVDGADFFKVADLIAKDNMTVIFDNQPRNRSLLRRIDKVADAGFQMMVWPEDFLEKDINQYIENGGSAISLRRTIDKNTYSGLTLKLRLSKWRKLDIHDRNFSNIQR